MSVPFGEATIKKVWTSDLVDDPLPGKYLMEVEVRPFSKKDRQVIFGETEQSSQGCGIGVLRQYGKELFVLKLQGPEMNKYRRELNGLMPKLAEAHRKMHGLWEDHNILAHQWVIEHRKIHPDKARLAEIELAESNLKPKITQAELDLDSIIFEMVAAWQLEKEQHDGIQ